MPRLGIPYVNRLLEVEIPDRNLIFDEAPRNVPPASDFQGTLRAALSHPIGTPRLQHLVRSGQKVIIISDDNTRLTPTKQIIPVLLDFLNQSGVPDRDIQIIIASGTHRAMTDAELDEKYGAPVMSRVKILPHRYKDPESQVEYGVTKRGTRILVNRHVSEADFRISVGNIIPHHPTGWSAAPSLCCLEWAAKKLSRRCTFSAHDIRAWVLWIRRCVARWKILPSGSVWISS